MNLRSDPAQLPPPTLADARLVGDPAAGSVSVLVGPGVSFTFERDGEDLDAWTGGEVLTAARGVPLSEAWLGRAREVAGEALRRALTAAGGEGDDAVRCQECGHVVCSPELRGAGEVKQLYCGPAHMVLFSSGRCLVLHPDGTARWLP